MKKASFDGVLCFGGEDWWYHNHGHIDLQMMREFSNRVPVLYINSLGMRIPKASQNSAFLKRIIRKLKSISKGYIRIRNNFSVLSLLSIPGYNQTLFIKNLMIWTIKQSIKKSGMKNPIIWVALPSCEFLLDSIPNQLVLYQRTDRFETEDDVDYNKARKLDLDLKKKADLTIFCTRHVFNEEKHECKEVLFLDHGVDYIDFKKAGDMRQKPVELQVEGIKKIIGFVGGLDPITIDQNLIIEIVKALPEYLFYFVGHDNFEGNWCNFDNALFLGKKPYSEVAKYMAAADVLIMPWLNNEWIKACNPIKLKEYLAIGRPVVTTYFQELDYYKNLVSIANSPEEFIFTLKNARSSDELIKAQRDRVEKETWKNKNSEVENLIIKLIIKKGESLES